VGKFKVRALTLTTLHWLVLLSVYRLDWF